MSNLISAPPPSSGIQWADLKGKLLIIEPLAHEADIQTAYGSADAVRANVCALIGPDEAEIHEETLIFPKLLVSQLRGQIGSKVVGRLGQGAAKASQSPPWILEPATADDLEKATAYIAKQAAPAVTSAAAPF